MGILTSRSLNCWCPSREQLKQGMMEIIDHPHIINKRWPYHDIQHITLVLLIAFPKVSKFLPAGLQERLQQDLREGKHHSEQHPDVKHLDVRGRRQVCRDPNETREKIYKACIFKFTYKEARTRRTVRLTPITMSM